MVFLIHVIEVDSIETPFSSEKGVFTEVVGAYPSRKKAKAKAYWMKKKTSGNDALYRYRAMQLSCNGMICGKVSHKFVITEKGGFFFKKYGHAE